MRRFSLSTFVALVASLGLLLAPAVAGETLGFLIKKPGGEYQPGVTADVDPGEKKTFKLKVTTPDPLPSPTQLEEHGEPDPPGYKTKYFRKDMNITTEVRQVGGYSFNLQPGHPKRFRMVIKASADALVAPFCRFLSTQSDEFGGDVTAVLNGDVCKF